MKATLRSMRRPARAGAAALAGTLALSGCSLDADNPRAITETGLDSPGAVAALVNGAIGDYDQAYQRSALFSGLISDELRASGTWQSWKDADLLGTINVDVPAVGLADIAHSWWGPLQRARHLAEESHAWVLRVMPGGADSELAAVTRLYSGMAYRDIGEYFCVATYDQGPAVERAQSLETAHAHLSEAIRAAGAAEVDSVAQMARLVRARVNLSLGRTDQALADARAVPDGFSWVAHFRDGPEEFNDMVVQLNQRGEATVQEPFRATGDPRVPVVDAGALAPDGVTPLWHQAKLHQYSDMPMGSWQEARLIEAEILLGDGDVPGAMDLVNQVRAAAELGALDRDLPPAEAVAALRAERRHELFLTGQRMLDMRRWSEFPASWQASCAPLPRSETNNNPNL